MNKKLTATIMALIFAASITGIATAASITCTVETIDNGKVLLNCGEKAADLKTGTEVRIKTAVTRKAVEGC